MKPMTITVTRPAPLVNIDGRLVPEGEPETFNIQCNIQPYRNFQKRFTLPEGFKTEDCLIVYSQVFHFRTSSVYSISDADRFTHKGFEYTVYQQQDWDGYGLNADHTIALAVKLDVGREVTSGP